MKELDERVFLCGIQVGCDEGRFLRVSWVDLYFLRAFCCVESLLLQGSTNIGQNIVVRRELGCFVLSLHPEGFRDFIEVPVAFI